MNKLKTTDNGGFPFTLNDLRFVDDSIRLALADITTGLAGSGAIILYGCKMTVNLNYISVSEGAIFYQGEVYHVYPHNFNAPNPLPEEPYWNIVIGNDASGSKVFYDGQSHQVYETRKAVASLLPIPGAIASFGISIPRLQAGFSGSTNLIFEPNCENDTGRPALHRNGNIVTTEFNIYVYAEFNLSRIPKRIATVPENYRPAALVVVQTYTAMDSIHGRISIYAMLRPTGELEMWVEGIPDNYFIAEDKRIFLHTSYSVI